jgi:uncharacterized protein YndB with AHSA1/START domain
MKGDLKFEAVYPYSAEQVWKALTDADALAEWLMPNNFQPRLGHRFQLRMKPAPSFSGVVECEVVALDPPRHLAYTWRAGDQNTKVSFRLEPVEDGTRVVLEHTGFATDGGMMVSSVLGTGWKKKIDASLPATIGRLAGASVTTEDRSDLDHICELLVRFENGAAALEQAVHALSPSDLDREPQPGFWSARQIAMHIVDAEIMGAGRLRMLAAEPGAVLKAYRGDVWGEKFDYKHQPLEPALSLFAALRASTAEVLKRLPAEAWANKGIREETGELTLENLLEAHCKHCEAHIQEITALTGTLAATGT